MYQQYIGFAIVLFILSMICERVADFLKHYFGEEKSPVARRLRKFFGIGNTLLTASALPADTATPAQVKRYKAEEEKRYFRILKINIACGFVIALLLHADVFTIFSDPENASSALNWGNYTWSAEDFGFVNESNKHNILVFLIGCLCTGLFISFGSKFWHDLLDLLLEVKNAKRLLAEPALFKVNSADAVVKMMDGLQGDLMQAAYMEVRAKYSPQDNVKAISLLLENDDISHLEFSLKGPDTGIPDLYTYTLANGRPRTVPIVKKLLGGNDIIWHNIDLSTSIFASVSPVNTGTLGCIVQSVKPGANSADRFILTCCHNVVFPAGKHTHLSTADKVVNTGFSPANPIGHIEDTILDFEVDAAMIRIDPAKQPNINNLIPQLGKPLAARTLTQHEVKTGHIEAYLCGAASSQRMGKVVSLYNYVEFTHSQGKQEMVNLIEISNNGFSITKAGDSGACVVDDNSNVLGLVVGGSPFATYVIPIQTILTKMKAKLV